MNFQYADAELDSYYPTEYIYDEHVMIGQDLIYLNEDVTQWPVNNFAFYSDDDSLDSAYQTEFDYSECSLLMDEDRAISRTDLTPSPIHPDQLAMQIQRNEELARLLSPIRKFQEQIQSQQSRKNAENARRKFSMTNGIRPKQRQMSVSNKPRKVSVSVRRWQSEILSKLPAQQKQRQNNAVAPNVNAPLVTNSIKWQRERDKPQSIELARRRFSWQERKNEEVSDEYYCSSR